MRGGGCVLTMCQNRFTRLVFTVSTVHVCRLSSVCQIEQVMCHCICNAGRLVGCVLPSCALQCVLVAYQEHLYISGVVVSCGHMHAKRSPCVRPHQHCRISWAAVDVREGFASWLSVHKVIVHRLQCKRQIWWSVAVVLLDLWPYLGRRPM